MVWKIALFIIILIEAFKLPLISSFDELNLAREGFNFFFFTLLPIIFYIGEIIINCNLGFYKDGILTFV